MKVICIPMQEATNGRGKWTDVGGVRKVRLVHSWL